MAWENSLHFVTLLKCFHREMQKWRLTIKRLQKFHTDDVSWSCSEGNCSSTNHMHSPDPGSDTSSLWNFCARSSDVISRKNHPGGVAKSPLFSQATEGIALSSIATDCRFQCFVACCSSKISIYGKRSKSRGNARVSKGKTRKGQAHLNGELARRLSALYSNPEFIWNERHSINSI